MRASLHSTTYANANEDHGLAWFEFHGFTVAEVVTLFFKSPAEAVSAFTAALADAQRFENEATLRKHDATIEELKS